MKYSKHELQSYTNEKLEQEYSNSSESYLNHALFAAGLLFVIMFVCETIKTSHSWMYIGEISILIGAFNAIRFYWRKRRIKSEIDRRKKRDGKPVDSDMVLSLKSILCRHSWEPLTGTFQVYEIGKFEYPQHWFRCTKCGTTRKFKRTKN